MAKLKTERMCMDGSIKRELDFKYDVYVDKEGNFSTTLPADVVTILEGYGYDMNKHLNRMRTKGYFCESTLDKLNLAISTICKDCLSRELVSQKIVIRYVIQTQCSYQLDINNEVVPNGTPEWTKRGHDGSKWKGGTLDINSNKRAPFGLQVYAQPFTRLDYVFKSGKTQTEYKNVSNFGHSKFKELEYYLKWLSGVCSIEEVGHPAVIKEIEYTEATAKFFVDMLKSICMINEKIKDFLDPESIKIIAESGKKLLG